jgi:hypothetical protein
MKRRRRSHVFVPLALAVVCAALGAGVYEEWRKLQDPIELPPPTGEPPADPGTTPGEVALKFPTTDSLASIAERPLFSEARRPMGNKPPTAIGAGTTASLTDFALTGTVLSGTDGQRFVTLRPADGSKDVSVAEGGAIQGWTVIGIEAGRAVFRRGDIETTLVLQFTAPIPPQQGEPSDAGQQPPQQGEPSDAGQQPPQQQGPSDADQHPSQPTANENPATPE